MPMQYVIKKLSIERFAIQTITNTSDDGTRKFMLSECGIL